MNKIQKLVKEGKLSQNLMANKDFVSKAEKIFKSENIDIDDKKLKQIMEQIESGLKKSKVLDDKDLEEVSGGVTEKDVARSVMKATTYAMFMLAGSLGGAWAGLGLAGVEFGNALLFDSMAYTMVGGATGGVLCGKLAQLICDVGLEENKTEKK
jgi:hypothetical protein